jgi:hypothetical protein
MAVTELESFGAQLYVQGSHACRISAGPVQASDKSKFDRIDRNPEDYWNSRGCRFGRYCRWSVRRPRQ